MNNIPGKSDEPKLASGVDLLTDVAAPVCSSPLTLHDRIILILLCIYILFWFPYQILVGTDSAYNTIHQQLIGLGIPSSEIDTTAVYTKILMYGLAPAVALSGIVALGMLLARHKRWRIVAVSALLSKTALLFAAHPVLVSVYEIHNVELLPEFKERMLYASIGKGVLSSIFTIPMSWYLIFRWGRLLSKPGRPLSDRPASRKRKEESVGGANYSASAVKELAMSVNTLLAFKRLVPAMGLLAVAACLVYVPHQAVLIRSGDNLVANIGYAFIWAPPPVEACMDYFNVRRGVCSIRPSILPAVVTSVAVAAITAGLTLIVGFLTRLNKPSRLNQRGDAARGDISCYVPSLEPFASITKPSTRSLAEMLRADLGKDFPVLVGNATEHDPLVISAEFDYIGCEYAVVSHVLCSIREEFKLAFQNVTSNEGRKIDELVFDVKPAGANEWSGRRRFYFDVTAGFNHAGRSS
jgi:hypothetical protein